MDRLNKKCFIASTGVHLLVGLVAFVGPAFTSSSVKNLPDLPVLNFEPDILTDADVIGGGNPRAGRPPEPAAQPQLPKPQPAPQPVSQPQPVQPVKPAQPDPEPAADPDNFEATPRKQKPKISLVPETRKNRKSPAADTNAQEQRKADEARRNAGKSLLAASADIRENTGGATSIREVGSYGPGGGGPSYASYAAYVRTKYDNAWIAPEETSSEAAVAEVRVTIARDGTVLSAEFTKRSGDRQVDASVQRALDRVPTIGRPFPEGAKENKRSYILLFDLKVKRGLA